MMNLRHHRPHLAVPLLLLFAVAPVFAAEPPTPGGKQCLLVPGRTPGSNASWDSFLGQAAHRIIAYMYGVEHPGRQVFYNRETIGIILEQVQQDGISRLLPGEIKLCPDIADAERECVFEIKPRTGARLREGRQQVKAYLDALNRALEPGKKFTGGVNFRGEGLRPHGVDGTGRERNCEMDTTRTAWLRMPAFLYGREEEIVAEATREGERCAEQYRREGTLPLPRELLEVPAGEVVVARDRVDFGWGQPRWRLYHLSKVRSGLWEDPPRKDSHLLSELLESLYLGTPWGALYFMLAHRAPQSAEREARRLEAVLRFWEPLQSVRYLYNSPGEPLSWEELMREECDWVLTAWSPEKGGSLRERLERGARRMARATREECVEAILRQVPNTLAVASPLTHREALADLELWREHLDAMDPGSFLEISSAWTSLLLRKIYRWDKQFDAQ